MSFNLDDVNVGGQLKVGSGVVPAVGEGDKRVNGSVYAEGPVQIGDQGAFGSNTATLMVGRTTNSDADCSPAALSVNVKGCQQIDGDSGAADGLKVTKGSARAATFIGGSPDAVIIQGDLFVSGSTDTGNKGRLASRFAAADASPKPFDLVHPTKGEGHRLRYACIEGPEVAVYCRGRLKESNVIHLPDYWKDLVHEDSITVQLQPIGSNQNLVIQEFNNEFIVIAEDSTNTDLITDLSTIDCFYHVYGERKDINPLIVEYEGNSWEDDPDPNYDPNKVDEDEKNTKDPRFDGPPNTFTK